jgi:hypothetical protein
MKYLSILFILVFLGCSSKSETPEKRFQLFLQAVESMNTDSVRDCLKSNSIEFIQWENLNATRGTDWVEKLASDTRLSKPKFSELEWIIFNRKAKIWYTYSGTNRDFLLLEKQGNRWYIDLFQKNITNPPENLKVLQIGSLNN